MSASARPRSRTAAAAISPKASRRLGVISDRYALLAEPAFHDRPDPVQIFLGPRLESHHENGLRVRCPYQSPSVAEQNADAVHVDHVMTRPEILPCLFDDSEFHVVCTVDPDFGSGNEFRDVGHHLAHALSRVSDDPQQPCSAIHRIVESVPALGEEHVPGHLTGDRRMRLVHLFLDQRVSRLPHEGLAAGLLDFFRERLRALHVEYDGLTLPCPSQYIARVHDEDVIAPDDLAFFVHDADSVSVAVERNADLRAISFNGSDKVHQIRGNRRIWMMVGKGPVAFPEENSGRHADSVEESLRDDRPCTVPAVDYTFQRT